MKTKQGIVTGTLACCAVFCGEARPQLINSSVENYGKLPMSFQANAGQVDPNVRFFSQGRGYGVYLTENAAVLALQKNHCEVSLQRRFRDSAAVCDHSTAVVRMTLEHNRRAGPAGEERLPGAVNYLVGNDPAKWHTGVPTFSKVRYRNVYPGIDLLYYGNQTQLEYDFVVAPGADPKSIAMRFDGATRMSITPCGDLALGTAAGAIAFRKPVIYQMVGRSPKPVKGSFTLLAGHTVGFELGSYDREKPLVIDPVLVYSTYLGGSTNDVANAIVTDPPGNVYVAGTTLSADFPVIAGGAQTKKISPTGYSMVFVTKLNPAGTALIYSTFLGGSGGDNTYGLAVDGSGNAYITGLTGSSDFPATSGAFQTTKQGTQVTFVSKLNPAGNVLVYSTYLGGTDTSYEVGGRSGAVAVDSAGNAYVAGATTSSTFPVTAGSFQIKNASGIGTNAFVTKLNATGSALIYSTYLGGTGAGQFSFGPAIILGDAATGLAIDSAGNAYVTGYAYSTNFPVTAGAFQTTNHAATISNVDPSSPGYNAFVTKINPAGSALVYSTYLGGSGVAGPPTQTGSPSRMDGDRANAVFVDSAGNAYVTGRTYSADFPVTTGAFQTQIRANQKDQYPGYNAFVTKLNATGTALVYSTFVGGSGADLANALAVDAAGNAYIAGTTSSTDFPVTPAAFQSTNKGADAFVTELNPTGTALPYSTYFGGSGILVSPGPTQGDAANGLALDASGYVYIAGVTVSADFPVTVGAFQTRDNATAPQGSESEGNNAFVSKLNLGAGQSVSPPAIRTSLGVLEGAGFQAALAPGGIASVFGSNLANVTAAGATAIPLAAKLDGTSLAIGSSSAPLFYVSPTQINFQIPWELAGQTQASVVAGTPAGNSVAQTVGLAAVAPGIFTTNSAGTGQGVVLISTTNQTANPSTPVQRGQYVSIYCSGLGLVTNQPATGAAAVATPLSYTILTATVSIGGVQAPVNFSGLAPGLVGLYQVNALVPATVVPGSAVPLVLSINGTSSNMVTIAVQ